MRFVILVSAVIEFLTQLPAALPSLLMCVAGARIAEYSFSMDRAEGCKCVAQSPAFV
jgi:hypothetical protein